ncbi:MAG: hypothetical protein KAQ68_03755 [Clostridiales bacterium]|nr:hypothetical protein [Clostridiales bacterium]
MNIFKAILSNGFVLMMPIFIWNIIFTSKLPSPFEARNFDVGIPQYILLGENLFRAVVFILPILFTIDMSTRVGKIGLLFYLAGCLIYFASWLLIIYMQDSSWSTGIFGFTAPAYTPIIWLVGISLMTGSYNIKIPYTRWHYLVPCIVFIGVHTIHSIMAYTKII